MPVIFAASEVGNVRRWAGALGLASIQPVSIRFYRVNPVIAIAMAFP